MNKKIVYAISLIFAFNNISASPTQPLSREERQCQLLLLQHQLSKFTPQGPIRHNTDEKIEAYTANGMWYGTSGTMTAVFRNSGSSTATFYPTNGNGYPNIIDLEDSAAVFQQLKSAYAAQQNK